MTEYIDRNRLLKDIGDNPSPIYKAFRIVVSRQPTADVAEVRRGKWTDLHNEDALYEQTYKCSVCGEWLVLETGTPKENECNYCPNCGAKMGDDEE